MIVQALLNLTSHNLNKNSVSAAMVMSSRAYDVDESSRHLFDLHMCAVAGDRLEFSLACVEPY